MAGTVLLVEDELFVALDLQDIIEEVGLSVDGPYISVASALDAVKNAPPDYAILDVRLADGEVYPVAEALQSAGVPFIFHSGHADAALLIERFPNAVVCGKPCSPIRLQDMLNRLTDDTCNLS
ncbi:Response regulator receiver domain-containing protein [Sphingobium sp. AP50]|uniref:response regulator n=1 Tax=Sphingobium sp. AP50 TaxID=1884369 RepID=UPI0008C70638|nr:response regulator [Sphingobium sp. AP50]SEJ96075.1 Response regulator receiver domain-containing protein [Sphingobium sp. AP50]